MINKHDSHTRLKLNTPLNGSLSLHEFGEKRLPHKRSSIQVMNLSVNDMKFSSHLEFPIDSRLKLYIKLQMLGQTHDLYGIIVWKKQMNGNSFHYVVKLHQAQISYIKSVLHLTGHLSQDNLWKLIAVS